MKEKFKLPKEWCIKVTEDNLEILRAWRTYPTIRARNVGGFLMYPGYYDVVGYYVRQPMVQEITFKQFQQYVLKTKQSYKYLIPILKKYNVI